MLWRSNYQHLEWIPESPDLLLAFHFDLVSVGKNPHSRKFTFRLATHASRKVREKGTLMCRHTLKTPLLVVLPVVPVLLVEVPLASLLVEAWKGFINEILGKFLFRWLILEGIGSLQKSC